MFLPRLFQLNSCFFSDFQKIPMSNMILWCYVPPTKKIVWKYPPPRMQSSHHQDYSTFSRGIPELNLHLWRLHPGCDSCFFLFRRALEFGKACATKVAIIAASSCTRRIGYGYLMCQNSGLFIATYSASWSPLVWWFSKGILYRKWPKHSG